MAGRRCRGVWMASFALEMPHSPTGFSSPEWATPPKIFRDLDAEFGFTLDACADSSNAKCSRYFSQEDDGLRQDWTGTVWCNPPYGRGLIEQWVKKAYDEAGRGALVVMLLPNSTDTRWFHDYCIRGKVRFLRGRLKFGGTTGTPTFGSMIVVFEPRSGRERCEAHG